MTSSTITPSTVTPSKNTLGAPEVPSNSGPGYAKHEGYTVTFEPIVGLVEVRVGNALICSTREAIRVLESRHKGALYLPRAAVRTKHLTASDSSTYCPFKGKASYHGLSVGGDLVADALWYYSAPYTEVEFITPYYGVYQDRVGAITLDGAALDV